MKLTWVVLAVVPLIAADVKVQGSLRSRFEGWNWFDSGTGDPDYALSGNLARLSFSQKLPKLDWQLEFAAPFLLGLDRAVLPAPQLQLGMEVTTTRPATIHAMRAWSSSNRALFGSTGSVGISRAAFVLDVSNTATEQKRPPGTPRSLR